MAELLLKASFLIGVALLFYKFVLQQESFFAANRLYLLGCLLLAFALPFVSLPKVVEQQGYLTSLLHPFPTAEPQQTTAAADLPTASESPIRAKESRPNERIVEVVNQVIIEPTAKPQPAASTQAGDAVAPTDWFFWLGALYFFGVAVFSLNLLFQLGSILLKVAKATDKVRDGACVLVNLPRRQTPCSFFSYIFINPDEYDFETYEQIMAHERIHVRQGHSLDLLIAELAVVVLWFNPLVWMYKKEVEKNLEFQTDALLLDQTTVSKQQYQLSLLQIATPHKPLALTTNYNQSLLKQRILMMNAKKSTPHGYWKYAFLAPLFFGMLLLLNAPATSQTTPPTPAAEPTPMREAVPAQVQTPATEPAPVLEAAPARPEPMEPAAQPADVNISRGGDRTDMSKGYWFNQQRGDQHCLRFRGDKHDDSRWSISDCYAKALFERKQDDLYALRRESGTLTLRGPLAEEGSQGTYEFKKDPDFERYLASNNIKSADQNFIFFLFLNDVGKEYISFLKTTYGEVPGDRLLEIAIHDISQQEYQEFIALFQTHSNKKPSMREVIEASIHDINQAYVQELQALGFKDLPLKKMMEARIHDVDRAYIEELRGAGYTDLSLTKIIEAKIHDLDAASINEIRSLGYDLSLDKIIDVKIHELDAAYLQDLKEAGFTDLAIDQALEARIHDITPAVIREMRALGYKDLTLRKIIELKIHDLDAAFVRELKEAGFPTLGLDKLLEARIHDVTGRYIKQARKNGYEYDTIDKYIQLKIHGMARKGDVWD